MEEWASKSAEWFRKNLNLNEEQTVVTAYAVLSLSLLLFPLTFIVCICRFFGVLSADLPATFTSAIFRTATGGAHLSTPWRCIFISTVLPVFFALLSRILGPVLTPWILIVLFFLAIMYGLVAIRRYAPAEVKEKPIRPEKRGYYRKLSFFYLVLWIVFSSVLFYSGAYILLLASILGFLWQMVTLTPFGFTLYHRLSTIFVKEDAK